MSEPSTSARFGPCARPDRPNAIGLGSYAPAARQQAGRACQVAELTGLSLRTIRWYKEEGLVVPTARTGGGFRLYSDGDVTRPEVIKRMKPLGFALEEMRELLTLLADLDAGTGDREVLLDRLRMFHEAATARVTTLREQLAVHVAPAGRPSGTPRVCSCALLAVARPRHGAQAGQAPRVEPPARGAASPHRHYRVGSDRATVACDH